MSVSDAMVVVGAYTQFDNLAHAPKGTQAAHGLWVFRLNEATHSLTLLSVQGGSMNPAFLRLHPKRNIVYAVTESIVENGELQAFALSPLTGQLSPLGSQDAAGKSTCYITLDRGEKHALCVNYWDSTISVLPLDENGVIDRPATFVLHPEKKVKAHKREDHLLNRQSEPHAHALVLDPHFRRVAYVPDLGEDCIRQHVYDEVSGTLQPAGTIPAHHIPGPHGPRYIDFHRSIDVAFVVNEISSNVAVYAFDATVARTLQPGDTRATLTNIQHISTIPVGFPASLNTCGRVTVDPSGGFVLVSNRGHNSLAVFRVNKANGTLSNVDFFHTRGRTPRHFQFGPAGTSLIVANQDTDEIAVFSFDPASGRLHHTCQVFDVPSPSFVLVFRPFERKVEDARHAVVSAEDKDSIIARQQAEIRSLQAQVAQLTASCSQCNQ